MAKLIRPYLDDILAAIEGVEDVIANKTVEDYTSSWLLRRGVERGIEIISEASRRIPENLRNAQPQIPWKRILGIGNVLRHDYKLVADAAIYEVATKDLAPLKAAILAIESSLDEPEE